MVEPCADWPIPENCSYGIDPDPETRPAEQAFAVTVATGMLSRATLDTFGVCPITVRPCGYRCANATTYPAQLPTGEWVNIACDCPSSLMCGCCEVCEIYLEGPINAITEVKVGGVVIPPSAYRVDNSNLLVRIDGGDCWPICQDLATPDTEPNTFSITYEMGVPVPAGGQRAVAALAAEILASCNGGACRLPARVQELVRQGERIQLINEIDFLRSGLTGIPEVDQWVVSVNPYGLHTAPMIWSPDLSGPHRVTTWTAP